MSEAKPWICPFCNHNVLITSENFSSNRHTIYKSSKYGSLVIITEVRICPNPSCKEVELDAAICEGKDTPNGMRPGKLLYSWKLLPEANVKVFPDYIPKVLLGDYREACLILDKSPKASATLARRCLQGMIRDYWGISKSRLKDEIDAIEEKVDPATWSAIDAVRQIGNIGAHMEKDINLIVEVSEDEAQLLISLIETLFNDWYIVKHERELRLKKIISISEEKSKQKNEIK